MNLDDKIDLWHEGSSELSLPDFLDLSKKQYANFVRLNMLVEFDNNYNKLVIRKEELRNGQTRVKEYNSDREYDTWGMYLVSISQAIIELKEKREKINKLIGELDCLL